MATDLKQLSQALRQSSPRTRMVAIGGALLVVAALAISGVIASRPHFVLLHGRVADQERVAVEKALAGAGIRYRISQPPGPYVLDVDESQFYEAQNAVAIAGALKRATAGIETGASGAATVFMTSAEKAQTMLKREWQELESMLGCLDFVASARVTTSTPDSSPLREKKPRTVSVTLELREQAELTAEQADNVARIVRYQFDVPPENVVITDQNARTLFAGDLEGESNGAQLASRNEHAREYERALESKANDALSRAYGPGKGYVTLASEWDYDLRTIEDEVIQPKTVLVDDERAETSTPAGPLSPDAGGPAGTASNIAVEGVTPPASTPAVAQAPATTTDQKRRYEAGRTRTRTVHNAPTLERLSVSLVLDESLAPKKDEIAQFVEALVGFEPGRKDVIRVSTSAIATAVTEAEAEKTAAPVSGGGSSTMKLLLQHGVELLAAIAFLFVALKTLKGAKGAARTGGGLAGGSASGSARGTAAAVDAEDLEPDPELVARVRVEELVRSDPRRVGEILSRWATETTNAGSSR